MTTDTHGLSRHEHLLAKIGAGVPLNAEEMGWAGELLSSDELAALDRLDQEKP